MLIATHKHKCFPGCSIQTGNPIPHPKGVEEQGWSVMEWERRCALQMCKTAGQMMSLKILCHLCYLLLLLKADIKFLYPISLCGPVVSSAGVRSAPNYQRQPAAAPKKTPPQLWTGPAAAQMGFASEMHIFIWTAEPSEEPRGAPLQRQGPWSVNGPQQKIKWKWNHKHFLSISESQTQRKLPAQAFRLLHFSCWSQPNLHWASWD